MTLDDKKKCSEIWQMASGDFIPPEQWTDGAGDELARFFAANYYCSEALLQVPRPGGAAPGWGWVVKQVYNVLRNRYQMKKGQVFVTCAIVSLAYYRSAIQAECL